MADQQTVDTPSTGTLQSPPQQPPQNPQLQPGKEEMLQCVTALEAALLPCLPARELQAIDRSPHPSHQSISLPFFLFFFLIIYEFPIFLFLYFMYFVV